jgi:hypothetical protein
MSISARYRQILDQIESEVDNLYEELPETTATALRAADMAVEELQDWVEAVGEIPQYMLESKLAPVLLKVHEHLDRARVLLEKGEHKQAAAQIWEQEQMIYRLLNDL